MAKVIIHNSISVDGSIEGFMPDLAQHYGILSTLDPDVMLVGSETAKKGIEQFCDGIPEEEEADFFPKETDDKDKRPYWVIIDSQGKLEGLLHVFRKSEYVKDVIVIITEATTEYYRKYLEDRHYHYISAGTMKADLEAVIEILEKEFAVNTIVTDSGTTLNSRLLTQNLADELSLIISPVLTGNKRIKLFGNLNSSEKNISLDMLSSQVLENGNLYLKYKINR